MVVVCGSCHLFTFFWAVLGLGHDVFSCILGGSFYFIFTYAFMSSMYGGRAVGKI